jgi:uncharacterized zinc-type alcohol dehydrogenase-like protein
VLCTGEKKATIVGHAGGFADKVRAGWQWIIPLPENLDPESAGPLLCGGITVFDPILKHQIQAVHHVGVIGIGGLGHMAIKLAKGLGAEVTLFSRTPRKTEDAKALGTDHVVISTDEDQMKSVFNKFDLIIDTVPYEHDINPYMQTLTLDGTLVLVGLIGEFENYAVSTRPMIYKRRSVAGSLIGGIKETQEMLDFCGEKNIVSDIEIINIQDINDAYERMLKSDVKYRFVIDMKSLKD